MAELSWATDGDPVEELHVTLTGELDISNVERFEGELMQFERERPALIVLDLKAVRFIDSTGLSLLLNADARARRQDRHVTIVSGNGAARRIMRTVALDQILDVKTDLQPRERS
ncbi:MAG: anti-sigma factor antagonist [Thermoleophilaceae bacterium]|jgi:anti-sigma B factor antagonist|nr:anti-sigma factor antagonist [Thermoleophilaceae bacterium]